MKNTPSLSILLLLSLVLSACGGSDHKMSEEPVMSSMSSSSIAMLKLSVVVTNLTGGQPLSPTAVVIHKPSFKAFEVGMPASVELEKIAEGGNPTSFLADANLNTATLVSAKAAAGIPPGMSATIMLETPLMETDKSMLRLTALSMLGRTNDGFTGLNGVDISKLAVGDSMMFDTISYDAGTEQNTETAATVPGIGGEGFNPMRDDTPSTVAMHPGVLTKDDGNPNSGLTNIHRWDNPVARITITRVAP